MTDNSLAVDVADEKIGSTNEYHFSNYVFNSTSLVLYRDGEELSVEPQVLEVLHYLIKHNDRYVQIEELHQEVWKGRVVSDAAVRRAISKLRACLNDDVHEEPLIKSAHKRGYKFNVQVTYRTSQTSFAGKQAIWPVRRYSIAVTIAFFVALSIWFLNVLFDLIDYPTVENVADTQVISSPLIGFQAEKTDLSYSADEKLLAFAGKNVGFQGFQLFVSDMGSKETKQLTINEDNVIRVEFGVNSSTIFYINLDIGNASLNSILINEKLEIIERKQLISGYYFLADLTLTPDNKGVYFTGIKGRGGSSQVFYLDFELLTVKEITSGYQNESHDYRISLSTDGKTLAVASVVGEIEQKISLFDTGLHKVKGRFFHESPLLSMEWLNKTELLLLDKSALTALNIDSGIKRELLHAQESKGLLAIDVSKNGNVIGLNEGQRNNFFVEVAFPTFQLNNKKMLTGIADNIEQAVFSGNKEGYFFLKKEEDTYSIQRKKRIDEEPSVVFSSTLPIKIQDISNDGNLILILLDGLLAILDHQKNTIDYIHNGDRLLAHEAIISDSGTDVIFGERVYDGWVVKSVNILTEHQKVLFEGFYSAREYKDGYLLKDDKGKVFIKRNDKETIDPLGVEVMIDKRLTWLVRGDTLYWSIHDGISAKFFAKNLSSGEDLKLNFDTSLLSSNFDISHNGNLAILKSKQLPNSQIVDLNLHN